MSVSGGNARVERIYVVRNGAVAVPADFVGLHFRAWPIFNSSFWAAHPQPYPSTASRAPDIGFGFYRSHDSGWLMWRQIETSKGVYDWSNMDTIVTAHRTAGRSIVYCLLGTPTFYLSAGNPARGTAGENSVYPDAADGLTGAAAFITAMVTRYNDPAGAWRVAHPTLGKGLTAIEYWNEPLYGTTGPGGFWDSSAALLVDLSKVVRDAAKAVDAAIMCVSPGFVAPNSMQTFMQASGVTYSGVTGLSLCDAVCIHYYRVMAPGLQLSNYGYEITGGHARLKAVIANFGGSALPLWCTETGIDGEYPTPELALIAAQSPGWRYNWWARVMMMAAAYGYQHWMCYAWDTPYMSYPDSDPNGTAKAIGDVHTNVAGKTIKNAFYDVGGAVTLQFSDGSSFSV